MIYPILVYGHPILRKKSEVIDKNYPNLSQLIEDLWETMYKTDGIGLAAPQIGLSIRLFVVDGALLVKDHPELKGFKKVFINAKIIEEDGERVTQDEGCLSLPTIREDVTRHKRIRVLYMDENFVQHDEVFNDQRARIIQHEYDHLEGKFYIDYLSPIRKRLIRGKLTSITQGKVKADYKIKIP
ncbi:MAG: peptide deformylase [Marinilabiliaceae bacterium]|nr:peptide deformylase [Marinilabiliaceae bacterium]